MTTTSDQRGIVERLGVTPVISARSRLTRLGGSVIAEPVWEAMREAGRTFFDMWELQDRVGARIAESTRNEAAYVTSGAAAGLVLSTAACITGTDPALIARLPHAEGLKNEVIIHRFQRNHYDHNVQTGGAKLTEIGSHRTTHRWELEAAIGPQTAAVLYFMGPYVARNILPLEQVIAIAHERGVPVLVDAAAQIPPSSNLWHYTTEMGADLAIFSGGKCLGGPQNTGMIVGRKDLIASCKKMGSPNNALGRPFKVGREEMVGLLAALEHYLERGEAEQGERCERWVRYLMDELSSVDGLRVIRRVPNSNTQPLPEVLVDFGGVRPDLSGDRVASILWEGNPRIDLASLGEHGVLINPDPMQERELDVLITRLKSVLSS